MAAHKGPVSLKPRCTRSGSSVAAIPVFQSTLSDVYEYYECVSLQVNTRCCLSASIFRDIWGTS
jgi:hypothetical protein